MRKIGIIGVGHVGSHVALSIINDGLCDELVLIDEDEAKSKAHALDLIDGLSYKKGFPHIYYNDYTYLDDADIVVVAVAGKIVAHERLKELETSKVCVNRVLDNLKKTKFNGIILSITNPCDIIACYIKKTTNYKVIGSGTVLDSSRLRMSISNRLNINPRNIIGYMLGEHGDSQFAAFSSINISGVALNKYLNCLNLNEIEQEVRFRATPIFNGKKCTEFAIGICAARIINAILNDTKEILPVSYFAKEYGYNDAFISTPSVIGKNGVEANILLDLSIEEKDKLDNCYEIIKDNLSKII